MKKTIKIISISCAIALCSVPVAGCSMFSSTEVRKEDNGSAVDQALASGAANTKNESVVETSEATESVEPHLYGVPEEGIDLDLTVLSGTMVYSEVYNMVNDPKQYVGKSVKIQGAFEIYDDALNGENVYACIVKDAAACCATGIEFKRAGNPVYPDDYPKRGKEIIVKGIFDIYEDGDKKYFTLKDADMQVV